MAPRASASTALSIDILLELLEYDALTGEFRWKVWRNSYGGPVKPGTKAGTPDKHGYWVIGINGRCYPAHRLAWYLCKGYWPTKQIDHINMDPLDNRIANLREASMTQQRANQKVRVDSQSGIKGVRKTKQGKYSARIKGINLGTFPDPTSASAAYLKAARRMFGEYARQQ